MPAGTQNVTEARMWTPHTVLLERDLSIFGHLRRGWRRCASYNRTEQQPDRDSGAG